MGRSYPRLPIEEFGRQLIESGDLDPVYIAMEAMEWQDEAHRARWLIAYWCLYHCGAASFLSEQPGDLFWEHLMAAAKNETPAPTGERWPRGHERRHWRGGQAVAACSALRDRYGSHPEDMVAYLANALPGAPLPFALVAERVQEHRSFGPWISFKIGDMLDRLGISPVNFVNADVFMFKDPALAAKMLFAQKQGWDMMAVKDGTVKVKDEVIPEVVRYLEGVFSDLTAPPIHDRPIGLQEVETVLCKWKSHMNGHYPIDNDIVEIREGLEPWASGVQTANAFLYAMPKGGAS